MAIHLGHQISRIDVVDENGNKSQIEVGTNELLSEMFDKENLFCHMCERPAKECICRDDPDGDDRTEWWW